MLPAAVLAVALAADLQAGAGATLVEGPDRPAVHIYSTDYVGYRADTGQPYDSHEWPLARALAHGEVVVDEVVEIEMEDDAALLDIDTPDALSALRMRAS